MGGRKHAEENRIRFQSFTERIAQIRISANVKVKRFDAIPEDAETFLGQHLHEWSTLNCSTEYSNFESQVGPMSESLPLVYYHRADISNLFKKHLEEGSKLSQETLLDLLVHFARDLSSEFVPFAKDFFDVIVQLSLKNRSDAQVLEWTFSCLAHLLKLHAKFFSEHLEQFLDSVMPLLVDNLPAYMRQFAAESFAFLVRKSPNLNDSLRLIVHDKLSEHPDCSYGLALVVFEVIKGANQTLLPNTLQVIELLIDISVENGQQCSVQSDLVQAFLSICAEHVSTNESHVIFSALSKFLQSSMSADSCSRVELSTAFLGSWLAYRGGMLCLDANLLAKSCVNSLVWHHRHEICCSALLQLFSTLVEQDNNALASNNCYVHLKNLFEIGIQPSILFEFSLRHVTSPLFTTCFLPQILAFLVKTKQNEQDERVEVEKNSNLGGERFEDEFDMCVDEEKADEPKRVEIGLEDSLLTILTKLALEHCKSVTDSKKSEHKQPVSLPDSVLKQLIALVSNSSNNTMTCDSLSQVWAVGVMVKEFKLIENWQNSDISHGLADALSEFAQMAKSQIENLSDDFDVELTNKLLMTLTQVSSCFAHSGCHLFKKQTKLDLKCAMAIAARMPNNLPALELCRTICDCCIDDNVEKNETESTSLFVNLLSKLADNLSNPIAAIREISLHLLEKASRGIYKARSHFGINVLKTLLQAERTTADLAHFKERLNLLGRLRADIVKSQPTSIDWHLVITSSLVGHLTVDFSPLHRPIYELLASYAQFSPKDSFWPLFSSLLSRVHVSTIDAPVFLEMLEDCDDFQSASTCSTLFDAIYNEKSSKCQFFHWATVRVRLWEALKAFSVDILESNSRHFVPQFLDFVENSFGNVISSAEIPLINLTLPSQKRARSKGSKGSFGERRHCLVTMLNLFAKLKHRSQLAQADKIVASIFRLLKVPRPELQKPALEFLINTNWPSTNAYKDMLLNLVDAKRYKSGLVEFGDLSSLTLSDREHLLPILLRLVFGQMHYVQNKTRSGKTGYAKKAASLGFLANVTSQEVATFCQIMLEPFSSGYRFFQPSFSSTEPHFIDDEMILSVDPSMFPSTELGFWFFHTFTDCCNNLHNVDAEQWRLFFRIAVVLYAMTMRILNNFKQLDIDPQHEKRLRRLRKLAFKSFSIFFARRGDAIHGWYKNYLESAEIKALFQYVVWPEFQRCETMSSEQSAPSGSELMPLIVLSSSWATTKETRKFLFKTSPLDDDGTCLMDSVFDYIKRSRSSDHETPMDLEIFDCHIDFFDKVLPPLYPEINEEGPGEQMYDGEEIAKVYNQRSIIIQVVSKVLLLAKKEKTCRKRLPKVLDIFHRVTAHVDNAECASEVFQLLLNLLSSNSLPSGASSSSALTSLLDVVGAMEQLPMSQLNLLALCFSRIPERSSRTLLCKLLQKVSQSLRPELGELSEFVHDMNAWSKKLDEPDYQVRLKAFSECTRKLTNNDDKFKDIHVLFLLNNCIHLLQNTEDFSIRANASELCTTIVEWAHRGPSQETSANGRKMLVQTLINACSKGIQHKSEQTRHEFIRILAHLVKYFPQQPAIIGLDALCDADPEADFFENMRHHQQHRRARAMRKLAVLLNQQQDRDKQMKLKPLTQFLMPLAQTYLSAQTKQSLVDASLELLKACCKHLPWPSYCKTLQRFLQQLLSGSNERITFNVRAIMSILDAYHFDSEQGDKTVTVDEEDVMETDIVEPSKVLSVEKEGHNVFKTIQSQIVPNLLEAINAQLLPGSLAASQCNVIPLTVAAVRLLVHCPERFRNSVVPSFVLKLIEFLKSRYLEVRHGARKALGQICLALGPGRFGLVLRDLKSGLTRGYQRHVLTYTAADLLKTCQPQWKPGQIDRSIKDLTQIFSSELFTVMSEEKEADCKVSGKWPEARRRAGLHAYPLMAHIVSKASLNIYLQPLKDVLLHSTDAEKVRKCRQVLTTIIPLLAQNPGIALVDLMEMARTWLRPSDAPLLETNNMKKKKEEAAKMEIEDNRLLEPRPKPAQLLPAKPERMGLAKPVTSLSANNHVMSEFGLRFIFSLIKHNRLSDATVDSAFNCDSHQIAKFAEQVHSLLKVGEHETVVNAALQLASSLLTFRVEAFTKQVAPFADSTFELLKAELLQKNTQSRLLVVCFKAAGILVEIATLSKDTSKKKLIGIDAEHMDALVVCIDEAIIGDRQPTCALQLFKKILDAGIKTEQLADVINGTITRHCLRGREEIQPLARACLLSYMLHYPVGPKRLETILEIFLGVLTNPESELHMLTSSLEIIFLVVSHFPAQEIDRFCPQIFLPVSALFVNNNRIEVRELVNSVLVRLLSRTNSEKRELLATDLVIPWLSSGQLLKQQLGCLVIVCFAEAEGESFERRLKPVLGHVVNILKAKASERDSLKVKTGAIIDDDEGDDTAATDGLNDEKENEKEEGVNDEEQVCDDASLDGVSFATCTALVRLVRTYGHKAISACPGGFQQLVSIATSLSLHAHAWIRQQIGELWFELFQTVESNKFQSAASLATEADSLKVLCRAVMNQGLTKFISPTFSEKVAANCVFLSRILLDLKPFNVELLLWMCRRMVRIAMAESIFESNTCVVKRLLVFKWMAAFIADVASREKKFPDGTSSVATILVVPLAREIRSISQINVSKDGQEEADEAMMKMATSGAASIAAAELGPVVDELSELFRSAFGVETFTVALNKADKDAQSRKLKRNADKASLAITDPARAARIKAFKQASKRESRKRKMLEEKAKRGANVSKRKS